jgi:hypothetical protein
MKEEGGVQESPLEGKKEALRRLEYVLISSVCPEGICRVNEPDPI